MSQPPTNKTTTARARANVTSKDAAAAQQSSPPPAERAARATSLRSAKAARAELIKESKSTVKDVRTAKEWLRERGHMNPGEDVTAGTLVLALLRDACDPNTEHITLIDTSRAVALCLEQCQKEDAIRDIISKAKEEITEAKVEAAEMLQKMVDKAEERMKAAQEKLTETVASSVKEASKHSFVQRDDKTHRTDDRVHDGIFSGTQARGSRASYAQALASQPAEPPSEPIYTPYFSDGPAGTKALDDIKAKEGRRAKQILVDGIDGITSATAGLTCKELVEKANLAWESLPKSRARDEYDDPEDEGDAENINRPSDIRFVTAMKLRNGGVVFECNHTRGTDWLRHRVTKQEFEQKFGGSAILKKRAFTLIVGYLPVKLKGRLVRMGTEIERDNDDNIREGSIKKLRWMRNPETSWRQDQMFAHALITVDDKQTANNIIRNGIAVDGERRWVKKIEDEPKRCYRCQLVDPGHRAATCDRPEVCANCGSAEHQTGRCKAKDNERQCASCTMGKRVNNHASWDRACPVYIERKLALRDRDPENHFRFYPDEHAEWTWEQRFDPGKPGETAIKHTGKHPASKAPTLGSVIPKPDKRSMLRRQREEHLDDEEIAQGTQALIDMLEDGSDPGDDEAHDRFDDAPESQEEDDDGEEGDKEEEEAEEEEGQIHDGEQAETTAEALTRAWRQPQQPSDIELMWDRTMRPSSAASSRNAAQSKLPAAWSQIATDITSSSGNKKTKTSSRK